MSYRSGNLACVLRIEKVRTETSVLALHRAVKDILRRAVIVVTPKMRNCLLTYGWTLNCQLALLRNTAGDDVIFIFIIMNWRFGCIILFLLLLSFKVAVLWYLTPCRLVIGTDVSSPPRVILKYSQPWEPKISSHSFLWSAIPSTAQRDDLLRLSTLGCSLQM